MLYYVILYSILLYSTILYYNATTLHPAGRAAVPAAEAAEPGHPEGLLPGGAGVAQL